MTEGVIAMVSFLMWLAGTAAVICAGAWLVRDDTLTIGRYSLTLGLTVYTVWFIPWLICVALGSRLAEIGLLLMLAGALLVIVVRSRRNIEWNALAWLVSFLTKFARGLQWSLGGVVRGLQSLADALDIERPEVADQNEYADNGSDEDDDDRRQYADNSDANTSFLPGLTSEAIGSISSSKPNAVYDDGWGPPSHYGVSVQAQPSPT